MNTEVQQEDINKYLEYCWYDGSKGFYGGYVWDYLPKPMTLKEAEQYVKSIDKINCYGVRNPVVHGNQA